MKTCLALCLVLVGVVFGGCCNTDQNGKFCMWVRSAAEATHERMVNCCTGTPPQMDQACKQCVDDLLFKFQFGTPGQPEFLPGNLPNPDFFPSLPQILEACEQSQDARLKRYLDMAISAAQACQIMVPGLPKPSNAPGTGAGGAMANPTPLLGIGELVQFHCQPQALRTVDVDLALVNSTYVPLAAVASHVQAASSGVAVVITTVTPTQGTRYAIPAGTSISVHHESNPTQPTMQMAGAGTFTIAAAGGTGSSPLIGVVTDFSLSMQSSNGWTVVLDLDRSCRHNAYSCDGGSSGEMGLLLKLRLLSPTGTDLFDTIDPRFWVRIPMSMSASGQVLALGSATPMAGDLVMPPTEGAALAMAAWEAAAGAQPGVGLPGTSGCTQNPVPTPNGGSVNCALPENECANVNHPYNPSQWSTCAARAMVCRIRGIVNNNCFPSY